MSGAALFDKISARLPLARASWTHFDGRPHPRAAVLVALTREVQPRVLLGRRAKHLPLHPGEIAFAGGKEEAEDLGPWDTALRETLEEVGLAASLINPLGEFDSLLTRTGFEVYPCIATIPAQPELVVDPSEFDSVFLPDLTVFADRHLFRLETFGEGETRFKSPHYQVGDDDVWGVTAAILAQLANVAYDAGLDLERNWKQRP